MKIVGIGLDLVKIARIQSLTERWQERFLQRLFTDEERQYCFRRAFHYLSLAGRFAAKEAVLKALGTDWSGGIRWVDIQCTQQPRRQASGHREWSRWSLASGGRRDRNPRQLIARC